MTIIEMYQYLSMTRKDFSIKYSIPEEELSSWESDPKTMPVYVQLLLERVIKEDKAEVSKNLALEKLYEYLDHPVSQSKWDIEFDYLSEITARDDESYWVYKDEVIAAAIRITDQQLITDENEVQALNSGDRETDFEQLELDSLLRSQSFL